MAFVLMMYQSLAIKSDGTETNNKNGDNAVLSDTPAIMIS
jgi:hypothetical protein